MSITPEEFELLKKENEALKLRLEKIDATKEKRRKSSIWFAKKFSSAFAGKWLKNSFLRLYTELPENRVQTETLADLTASLLWRLTRIGVVTLFLAILPTLILLFQTNILLRQNKILAQQNVRLDQQTNLAEATRRGTVTLEMSNIMDQIDDEMNSIGTIRNATKTRVITHVQSLKPYKFLENDELTERALSPERAQLFLYLLTSKLSDDDKLDIFKNTKFADADLQGAYLNFLDAAEARLPYARLDEAELLGSDWDGVELQNASLKNAHVEGSNFISGDMSHLLANNSAWFQVNLSNTDLLNANFSKSLFNNVSFKNCNWEDVNMQDVVLSSISFSGKQDISKANWDKALVDNDQWLQELQTKKVEGANKMIEQYKIGKSVDLDQYVTTNPWLLRFKSMNKGKLFYLLEKK
ncbi:MAG: pentapeptide repeat-containing protein [Chitinophagales bacterium]